MNYDEDIEKSYNITLNSSNLAPSLYKNTYQYNFQQGSIDIPEDSEMYVNEVILPYSWYNVSSALGNNTYSVYAQNGTNIIYSITQVSGNQLAIGVGSVIFVPLGNNIQYGQNGVYTILNYTPTGISNSITPQNIYISGFISGTPGKNGTYLLSGTLPTSVVNEINLNGTQDIQINAYVASGNVLKCIMATPSLTNTAVNTNMVISSYTIFAQIPISSIALTTGATNYSLNITIPSQYNIGSITIPASQKGAYLSSSTFLTSSAFTSTIQNTGNQIISASGLPDGVVIYNIATNPDASISTLTASYNGFSTSTPLSTTSASTISIVIGSAGTSSITFTGSLPTGMVVGNFVSMSFKNASNISYFMGGVITSIVSLQVFVDSVGSAISSNIFSNPSVSVYNPVSFSVYNTLGYVTNSLGMIGNYYTQTLPDGFYDITAFNNSLSSFFLKNSLYFSNTNLLGTSNQSVIYPIQLSNNYTNYNNQITYQYLPINSTNVVTQFGTNWSWAGGTYPNTASTFQLTFSSGLGKIFGFSTGTYPSTPYTYSGTPTLATSIPPVVSGNILAVTTSVNNIIIRCNIVDNQVNGVSDILDVIPIDTTFGSNINYLPVVPNYAMIKSGRFSNFTITFCDQSFNPIYIQDPNIIINLIVKIPKKK